jgi:hypothetical protein
MSTTSSRIFFTIMNASFFMFPLSHLLSKHQLRRCNIHQQEVHKFTTHPPALCINLFPVPPHYQHFRKKYIMLIPLLTLTLSVSFPKKQQCVAQLSIKIILYCKYVPTEHSNILTKYTHNNTAEGRTFFHPFSFTSTHYQCSYIQYNYMSIASPLQHSGMTLFWYNFFLAALYMLQVNPLYHMVITECNHYVH